MNQRHQYHRANGQDCATQVGISQQEIIVEGIKHKGEHPSRKHRTNNARHNHRKQGHQGDGSKYFHHQPTGFSQSTLCSGLHIFHRLRVSRFISRANILIHHLRQIIKVYRLSPHLQLLRWCAGRRNNHHQKDVNQDHRSKRSNRQYTKNRPHKHRIPAKIRRNPATNPVHHHIVFVAIQALGMTTPRMTRSRR